MLTRPAKRILTIIKSAGNATSKDIADSLGKKRLNPYDRRLLREMEEQDYIVMKREVVNNFIRHTYTLHPDIRERIGQ